MLRSYPAVRLMEQTGDVLRDAQMRLWKALENVVPQSTRHYYNLAALEIRRQLIDLARHYKCRLGQGMTQQTEEGGGAVYEGEGCLDAVPDGVAEPKSLEGWTAFHEAVETLPDAEQEVFSLLWYEGLTQERTAEVLGVSLRTVKRRWQDARVKIFTALGGEMPGPCGGQS
jgi:RNA polymerase sigma-70 factor (ECF subfamily)